MAKKDLLTQVMNNSFNDLYLDNKPKTEDTQTISTQEKSKTEDINITKSRKVELPEEGKEPLKMFSIRVPVSLTEKVKKYNYVNRITTTDIIIQALESFLAKDKNYLSEYDRLKGNK